MYNATIYFVFNFKKYRISFLKFKDNYICILIVVYSFYSFIIYLIIFIIQNFVFFSFFNLFLFCHILFHAFLFNCLFKMNLILFTFSILVFFI